jgi:hypothetical protein
MPGYDDWGFSLAQYRRKISTRHTAVVAIELTAEDKLAARRLNGLLDYVEAFIKLDERPATQLAQHKLADGSQFILHQHELAGLPE